MSCEVYVVDMYTSATIDNRDNNFTYIFNQSEKNNKVIHMFTIYVSGQEKYRKKYKRRQNFYFRMSGSNTMTFANVSDFFPNYISM